MTPFHPCATPGCQGKPRPGKGRYCPKCNSRQMRERQAAGIVYVRPVRKAKDQPEKFTPDEIAKFDAAWNWITTNGPARKTELSRRIYGHARNSDTALLRLEAAGYLLSEDSRGLLYAFGRTNA